MVLAAEALARDAEAIALTVDGDAAQGLALPHLPAGDARARRR